MSENKNTYNDAMPLRQIRTSLAQCWQDAALYFEQIREYRSAEICAAYAAKISTLEGAFIFAINHAPHLRELLPPKDR